jgi:hypothetical protein
MKAKGSVDVRILDSLWQLAMIFLLIITVSGLVYLGILLVKALRKYLHGPK